MQISQYDSTKAADDWNKMHGGNAVSIEERTREIVDEVLNNKECFAEWLSDIMADLAICNHHHRKSESLRIRGKQAATIIGELISLVTAGGKLNDLVNEAFTQVAEQIANDEAQGNRSKKWSAK